jgi:hypothetical protein
MLAVCEAPCDVLPVTCGACFVHAIMGVVSRVVSSRTIWCLAYLYSECYAVPESLVYAVTQKKEHAF